MSQIIQFLERLGSDSTAMDDPLWLEKLKNMDISEGLQQAFINKDQLAIESFLGADTNLMSILFPAEEEQPSEQDHEEDEKIKKVS